MRKVIVNEWMSLDGVAQAPTASGEDASNGFEHGGWHLRYFDDLSRKWVLESLNLAGGFLFGRRTYELFAAHWPQAGEDEQPVAQPLNTRPKYVASTTLTDPLAWQNSTVLEGDVVEAVAALKQQDGGDLHVLGSTQLVHRLTSSRPCRQVLALRSLPSGPCRQVLAVTVDPDPVMPAVPGRPPPTRTVTCPGGPQE